MTLLLGVAWCSEMVGEEVAAESVSQRDCTSSGVSLRLLCVVDVWVEVEGTGGRLRRVSSRASALASARTRLDLAILVAVSRSA